MKIYLSPSNQTRNLYYDKIHNERQVAEWITKELVSHLKNYDIIAVTTHSEDLFYRTTQANTNKCDYYLAIHTNAGGGSGAECFYQNGSDKSMIVKERSKDFAYNIVRHLAPITDNPKLEDRGIKYKTQKDGRDWNGELRRCKMPACLVEIEFHDTPNGCAWILDNIHSIAEVLAMAIVQQTKAIKVGNIGYYPSCLPYNGPSIVDGLKSIGIGANYATLERIAVANRIFNYRGTADQNIALLKMLKEGKLIKP